MTVGAGVGLGSRPSAGVRIMVRVRSSTKASKGSGHVKLYHAK
jgi:hypothetical protein